jgi:hypothetical protein
VIEAWIHELAHASPMFLVFALVGCGFGLYLGFTGLHRYRLIEDVPTAKVRSAHQGYVELIGRAVMMDGEPIVAPLSQLQCCWYQFSVQRRSGKNWNTVNSGTSDSLFVLRDDTGDCVIDPEGAEVDTVHSRNWHGSSEYTSIPHLHARFDQFGHSTDAASGLLGGALRGIHFGSGHYRFRERVILDNDPLYAIGWFKSLDDSDRAENERVLTREILREWKRSPALLQQFDRNGDGSIDTDEWEQVRRAAKKEAREQLAEAASHTHVHTLSKPNGRHFLLSNRDEETMVRRYKWRAAIGFSLFFVGGGVSTLMITTQFLG